MSSGEQRPEGADTVFSTEKLQAAVQLGLRYLTGNGVPPDPGRGVALIEKAAELGDAEASYFAATLASSSLWRPLDWDRAFDCLLCFAPLSRAMSLPRVHFACWRVVMRGM